MIKTRKELAFYIKADMMMNRGYFTPSLLTRLRHFFFKDSIMSYLNYMRNYAYYKNTPQRWDFLHNILKGYYKMRFVRQGEKLGFSIGENCCGYGLVLHHFGTIVIGTSNRVGNYALINTSTCIVNSRSNIGNALFLGAGTIISKKVVLGDNIVISAASLVNKSFVEGNIMLAGSPAKEIRKTDAWYSTLYPSEFNRRKQSIEELKRKMGL